MAEAGPANVQDSQGVSQSNPSRRTKRLHIQRTGPLRGLLETFILGTTLMISLLAVSPQIPANATQLGMAYIGAACALWYTLRLRIPIRSWWEKALFEGGNAGLLGIVIGLLLPLIGSWLGLLGLPQDKTSGGLDYFLLMICIPGFAGLRILQYGWLFWDRLRRRKILWGLVHTQLSVVVAATALAAVAGAVLITFDANRNFPETTLAATLARRIVLTIIPFFAVATFSLVTALMAILPPTALISYLYSRQMTRRLEALTQTTAALKQGDYTARVVVSGADEVAQLQTDFNAMAEKLEDALASIQAERDKVTDLLAAQRQLTASVSHELRTPLATIQGYLEPLAAEPDSVQSENLAIIQREAHRLQRLIDDLFTLSRIEVEALNLHIRPVNVGAVIHQMVETHAPLAWRRGRVEVVAQVEYGLPTVSADEGRLEQILTNLLHNAVRHTPPGGIVAVTGTADESGVQIEVRDTGEGIASEDLPLIWERFYRGNGQPVLEDQREQRGGTGLGLTLVKELTESMGGCVGVESEPGEGSVFTIWLPLALGAK